MCLTGSHPVEARLPLTPAAGPMGGMVRSRRGFTLIEMLVVVGLIAMLAGLLFPALSLLRNRQKRFSTIKLMSELQVALDQYLATYPMLGAAADGSDFAKDPYKFLYRDPVTDKKPMYIELRTVQLAVGTAPGGPFTEPAVMKLGQHILDAWSVPNRANRLLWEIVNGPNPGAGGTKTYTDKVYIRSTAGTPNKTKDDIIMRMLVADGRWEQKTWADIQSDTPLPTFVN